MGKRCGGGRYVGLLAVVALVGASGCAGSGGQYESYLSVQEARADAARQAAQKRTEAAARAAQHCETDLCRVMMFVQDPAGAIGSGDGVDVQAPRSRRHWMLDVASIIFPAATNAYSRFIGETQSTERAAIRSDQWQGIIGDVTSQGPAITVGPDGTFVGRDYQRDQSVHDSNLGDGAGNGPRIDAGRDYIEDSDVNSGSNSGDGARAGRDQNQGNSGRIHSPGPIDDRSGSNRDNTDNSDQDNDVTDDDSEDNSQENSTEGGGSGDGSSGDGGDDGSGGDGTGTGSGSGGVTSARTPAEVRPPYRLPVQRPAER